MIDATRSTHNQEIINSYITGYNKGKLDSKIEFIEKAREWMQCIDFEVEYFTIDSDGYTFFNADKFIEDFCKTMEE